MEKLEKKELVRCFICLELSREAINYIEELQELLKKKNLFQGKLTDPENLHLTLKFLGEIEPEKVEKIKNLLSEIKFPKFEAKLGECGLFSKKSLRILWIKLLGKGVYDLQKLIDDKLSTIFPEDFPAEERFMGHITIARMKKVFDRKLFLEYVKNIKTKKISFSFGEFVFKSSILKPEGPDYKDIGRYGLE